MTAKRRCIAGPSAQKAADGKLLCDEIVSADTHEGGIPVKRLSQTLFQLPPVPGEVATNTGKHQNFKSGGRLSDGAASFQKWRMTDMENVDVYFVGVLNLLRSLVSERLISEKEARKIAARIAAKAGSKIVFSF